MIELRQVTFTYPSASAPTLSGVDLDVPEGELCLVVGGTGSGKSTLLGLIDGLVPHHSGGRLAGRVTVAGRDTRDHPPRELADVVGVVGQDPLAGFVTETVDEELAYGMEQLGVAPDVMRKRVEETIDALGIAELRGRPLRTLSGGQQQRVAIGAVLTAGPRVLVLDEPTSALDPTAAEEVLATITRLVHDLGLTVVMAEHRLERVVQYADRMIWVPGDGGLVAGGPDEVLAVASVAPPVVRLGRLVGWEPAPRSVRDARRLAGPLRDRLSPRPPVGRGHAPLRHDARPALSAADVRVRYGDVVAVADVDLDLAHGEVVALMGRNGSGKSSLLWALQGAGPRQAGTVSVPQVPDASTSASPPRRRRWRRADHGGDETQMMDPAEARRRIGLVPQTPGDLLYHSTVAEECVQADEESGADAGTCRDLVDRIAPNVPDDAHPRDLSEGQRLALVLAIQLSAAPPVVLLDEPTRGLDYGAKQRFGAVVRELARDGRAVVVASHDVEFVAAVTDRVVVLADGEVVADGPTAEVVVASPAFAPQVAKILHPEPWLTVAQVSAALGAEHAGPGDGTPDAVTRR